MEELAIRLAQIPDTYFEFEDSVLDYAKRDPLCLKKVLSYIRSNEDVTTSDVLRFLLHQEDFYE